MPPWWWAAAAAERSATAAASLGTGWGTSARQLLGAVGSVPVSSWILLLLALYLARHVRSIRTLPHTGLHSSSCAQLLEPHKRR